MIVKRARIIFLPDLLINSLVFGVEAVILIGKSFRLECRIARYH